MKKIFTLLAVALIGGSMSVNAQTTLVDFNAGGTKTGTITISGTTEETTVKIHLNKDAVSCLKLNNGYTSNDVINKNYISISTEGGFKAGDVVTIAGAFNNTDDTKESAVDVFTGAEGEKETVLFTTQKFINGRLVEGDPVEESFTLTEDVAELKLGRNGNTGTNITVLKVVRGTSAGINNVVSEKEADPNAPVYNLAGQRVDKNTKGILIQNGKKFVNK